MKMSQSQKKRIKSGLSNLLMQSLGALFGRKPQTNWSVYETDALSEIGQIEEDDLTLLGDYYLNFVVIKGFDPRRRDLVTLLNNWNTELDRARNWQRNKPACSVTMSDLRQRLDMLDCEIERKDESLREINTSIRLSHTRNSPETLNALNDKKNEVGLQRRELSAKRRAIKAKMLEIADQF